jgi:predicted nucleotidyltransferase
MKADTDQILAELGRRLRELYGHRLARLVLFGSRARGDSESGSDIDVLVVLRGQVEAACEIERTGYLVAELSLAFDEVISCVFMSEGRYSERTGPLLRNIEREGVVL